MDASRPVMPADFEQQAAILIGVNELLPHHPRVLVDLFTLLIDHIPLVAVVRGEDQRRDLLATLCDWGLPAHRLHSVSSQAVGLWVRDYGPTFVHRGGGVCIIDPDYYYPGRPADDRFPSDLAELFGVDVHRVPLNVEGGNILSNGQGLAVISTSVLDRNVDRYSHRDTLMNLASHYGFTNVAGVRPLIGGPTAHADMFAAFTSPDTLLLGRYDPADDPVNARQLDVSASHLSTVQTAAGPLKIERIRMPPHRDRVWRTYTNALFVNDLVLVPTYCDVKPAIEREALDTWRRLLPGRRIVGVESTSLAAMGGALRCVTMNVPELGHELPPIFGDWHDPRRRGASATG